MKYNCYLYQEGKKPIVECFLEYPFSHKYAKTYAEDFNSEKAYVQLRELDGSAIGKLVFDSRKQTIVDDCGRYEVKDKTAQKEEADLVFLDDEEQARALEAIEDYSDDWSGFWEYEKSRGW